MKVHGSFHALKLSVLLEFLLEEQLSYLIHHNIRQWRQILEDVEPILEQFEIGLGFAINR